MPDPEITFLIEQWQRGDKAAENALFAAMYRRLHSIAAKCLTTEPKGQSMTPTALVHEAYVRFQRTEQLKIADRAHFLALTARVMRRILVDRARARQTLKRVTPDRPVDSRALITSDNAAIQILGVERALEELSKQSARLAQLVELRFFAGFSVEESAIVLGLSTRQTRRDWQVARTRLRLVLDGTDCA